MSRMRLSLIGSLGCLIATGIPMSAQQPSAQAPATPRTIVVELVDRPGSVPFAFEPATFAAHHGDTLRFVQRSAVMHNVHFEHPPKGSSLGGAAMSPYLTAKGESYTIVVDSRFVDGTYEIACDPHESLGMRAMLSVSGGALVASHRP